MKSVLDTLTLFGYSEFRPLQREAIESLVNGDDVLLVTPTGSGKSLVYQIASVVRPGVGIIISPLLSLMHQQVVQLKKKNIKAEFLNSSLNPGEQDDLVWSLHHQQVDLLFLSPEKILQPSVLGFLSHLEIALVAIDEAHCITQWGGGFRPEYGQLSCIRETFADVPIIALTATADTKTKQSIETSLQLKSPVLYTESYNRKNIELIFSQKKQAQKQLLYFLTHDVAGQSGIIYCRSRKKVQQLSDQLNDLGLQSRYYHAALSTEEKHESATFFYQTPGAIMVATTAFGMGIDVANIRFVVHMDLPMSVESYYQEVGRAGRDGLPAKAVLFYGLQDMMQLFQFEDDQGEMPADDQQEAYTKLFAFIESRGCRRKHLLHYFGEVIEDCGNCDRCKNTKTEQNVSIAAQKFLSLVYYTKGMVSVSTLIQILHGKLTKSVIEVRGNELPLFGQGRELTDMSWKGVVRQLLADGCLTLTGENNRYFNLTEQARSVLKGKRQVIITSDFLLPRLKEEDMSKSLKNWLMLATWFEQNRQQCLISLSQLKSLALDPPTNLATLSRLTGISQERLQQGKMKELLSMLMSA